MLLPYDTTMSYWMMAVPRFEWQAEPPGEDVHSAVQEAPCGANVVPIASTDPAVAMDPAVGGGSGGCDDAEGARDSATRPATLPQLRLVMTGMHWVVVPYWSPRENAHWNLMADEARDSDKQRTEATLRQTKRSGDIAVGGVGADHVAADGKS